MPILFSYCSFKGNIIRCVCVHKTITGFSGTWKIPVLGFQALIPMIGFIYSIIMYFFKMEREFLSIL